MVCTWVASDEYISTLLQARLATLPPHWSFLLCIWRHVLPCLLKKRGGFVLFFRIQAVVVLQEVQKTI